MVCRRQGSNKRSEITHDTGDADDAVQDCYLRAVKPWQAGRTITIPAKPRAESVAQRHCEKLGPRRDGDGRAFDALREGLPVSGLFRGAPSCSDQAFHLRCTSRATSIERATLSRLQLDQGGGGPAEPKLLWTAP